MKFVFLIFPIIYLIGNGYLFFRLIQALSVVPLWGKIVISVLFWIVALALFAAIGLRDIFLPEALVRIMFRVGSIWMVFLLYMVLCLIVLDIIKLVYPNIGNTLWYALPAIAGLMLYGYINYRHPKVNRMDITLDKMVDGQSMRMVVVSDIHLGYGTGVAEAERYVDLINAQQPDVVLIVGDLIDNSVKPLLQQPFDKALSALKAPMGIYMVPGNHEYISNIAACEAFLKATPVTLLRDSVVCLPNGVQIIGRDDRFNKQRQPLTRLLEAADKDRPTIVADHQPYDIAQTASLGVDMLLCGHTHRGQLFPINLLTDCIYEQSYGYRKWRNTHVWVSSGLSLWGPPFRIGTDSELVVIDIHPQEQ